MQLPMVEYLIGLHINAAATAPGEEKIAAASRRLLIAERDFCMALGRRMQAEGGDRRTPLQQADAADGARCYAMAEYIEALIEAADRDAAEKRDPSLPKSAPESTEVKSV